MWTPKRILLLFAGFVLFLLAYGVYGHFLGGIDGLSELPDAFLRKDNAGADDVPWVHQQNRAEEMLRTAFGEDCPELKEKRDTLEIHSKGMVLAFADFKIVEGRVRLSPLSLAVYGKTIPGQFPEINTVRAEVAYLTFDKPVTSVTEMNGRKIVAGELQGITKPIQINHNRRTPQTSDDITIFINHGPIFYRDNQVHAWTDSPSSIPEGQETRPHLWTTDYVELTDYQSRPKPITVQAKGMDLYLARSRPGEPAGKGKTKSEAISGVDQVYLRSSVRMRFYVDPRSGLFSASSTHFTPETSVVEKEKTLGVEKKEPPSTSERPEVVITTQGPFSYDVGKEFAKFDVPPRGGANKNALPENVVVTRFTRVPGSIDQYKEALAGFLSGGPAGPLPSTLGVALMPEEASPFKDEIVCDHLELKFHHRNQSAPRPPSQEHSPDLEIESAHATGGQVVLTSDAENLIAMGDDFFYKASTKQTLLRGAPNTGKGRDPNQDPFKGRNPVEEVQRYGMWARDKQGNMIGVKELEIIDQKDAQQATGKGAGEIYLYDKATGKYPLHASWNGRFTSAREGPYELITLIGDAVFQDDDHGQYLKGDNLKVWLLPSQQANAGQNGGIQQSRRPVRLEADGNVIARSPDFNVNSTRRLVVLFKEGPVRRPILEGTDPILDSASRQASPALLDNHSKSGSPGKPDSPAAKGIMTPAIQETAAEKKPSRPINLSALNIEADVRRNGAKNDLDQLRAEGKVIVKQAPATPEDKGVDIRGDTLKLTHYEEGNVLVVTGENLAQLQMDKLFILGTEITVDQVKNEATVDKTGAMVIDNDTDFEGNKLGRTVKLTIHWSKHMYFSGQYAEFHGGIQAEQENARMACQTLRVHLDRPISLKEGNKGEPAKVQNLVCDESVRVHDVAVVNRKIVKDQRIECGVLDVDKKAGTVFARLPGFVRIWQLGPKDPLAAQPTTASEKAKAPAPASLEMKLTQVWFEGWMRADNEKHSATFVDGVRVLHMPEKNPNKAIDLNTILNALPADAFYLSSDRLDVISFQTKDGTTKEMTAKGRVSVEGQDYSGRAALITYNEAKEQIILQGGDNGKARLYKYKGVGQKPDEIVAKKIIYSRLTGEHSTFDGEKFEGRP